MLRMNFRRKVEKNRIGLPNRRGNYMGRKRKIYTLEFKKKCIAELLGGRKFQLFESKATNIAEVLEELTFSI